jgi:hypothetical protein
MVEEIPPVISIGSPIPEVDVEVLTTDEEGYVVTEPTTLTEVLGDGTSILVGMPGKSSILRRELLRYK